MRLGEELDGSPPKHWIRQKEMIIAFSRFSSCIRTCRYRAIAGSIALFHVADFLAPHFYVCLTAPVAFFASLSIHGCFCPVAGRPPPRQYYRNGANLLSLFSCPFNAPS